MDCHDLQPLLSTGAPLVDPEARAHLASCAACRELAADGGRLARVLAAAELPDDEGAGDLVARSVAAVAADRGPAAWLAGRATPVRLGLALAAVALAVLGALLLAPRADLGVYPAGRMWTVVVGLGLVAVVAAALALRPLHRPAPSPAAQAMVLAAAVAVPLLLAGLPQAHALLPVSLEGMGDAFVPRALGCFVFGWAVGFPALVVARLADRRRRATWAPLLLSAGLGGLAGNLALQVHCPITHPEHLLAGHASVSVTMVMVLALVLLRRR